MRVVREEGGGVVCSGRRDYTLWLVVECGGFL